MNDRPPLLMKRRNFIILGFVGLMDVVLGGRLVTIQAIDGPKLKQLADSIHYRSVPLAPFRGNIVDRHGRLLAGSYHAYSAYAIPVQTRKNRQSEALLLSDVLHLPQSQVLRRLGRRQGFVWIKRRLSIQELQSLRVQKAALPGVYILTETARRYPEGELAAPVLGFTGIDNQGLAGVELTYNRYLEGHPGSLQEEYDATGQVIPSARQRIIPSQQGDTLQLSIDERIQWMAERACEQAMIATAGKSVSIVVMHPKTGGILAMAQRPTFDPNNFRDYSPKRYRELAVTDAIPPGSIFKPVTLAAALEEGVVRPSSGFYCPGFKVILGRRVNCWRPEGHGSESLGDVVKNSCNVGFMELGLRLGTETFYRYLDRFGLTKKTGIDLPGEALGIFPAAKRVTALDLAIMAFGQTLTVTPIGLLSAVSAIANGGQLMRPHVGRQIMTEDGREVRLLEAQPLRRVVSEHVAHTVQQMMANVVAQGTGKMAQVPGYRVAGKTGTAQKVINGRVEKGTYIASFIGYAPVPNPEVAMLVSVDEPQGAYFGGQVAAPVFGRLMKDVLRYLDIKPTEPIRPPAAGEPAMVPNLVNLDPAAAIQDAEAFGFPVQFMGQGDVVVGQSIEYGGWRPAGTVVTLKLGKSPRIYLDWVAVPRFVGLTGTQATNLALELGLNVHVRGESNRRVRRQTVSAGSEVRAGTWVTVWTSA